MTMIKNIMKNCRRKCFQLSPFAFETNTAGALSKGRAEIVFLTITPPLLAFCISPQLFLKKHFNVYFLDFISPRGVSRISFLTYGKFCVQTHTPEKGAGIRQLS
jgi:hypothetical protein